MRIAQTVFWRSLLLSGLTAASTANASVTVLDDARHSVTLSKPAQRIISLAPHATELLFQAGAGHLIVAVSDYSDYPEAAKKIISVGSILATDLERLIALKPDLVVLWGTGNAKLLASKLRNHHVTVYESEPRDFETIASSLERLAHLAGTDATGKIAANNFRERLNFLTKKYQLKDREKPLSVFYQIWSKPLMTLNDQHLVSSAIRLCGGKNIFGTLKEISPTVSTEAVLAANPQVIISSSGEQQDSLLDWRRFPHIDAVKKANLFTIKEDLLNRSGPRVLDGTETLCQVLAATRNK
jgi:iron complex transport system substrate-binding protein